MKKLSKQQIEDRDALVVSLRETESSINQMIEEANSIIAKINGEKVKLESVISDVESWRDDIVTDLEAYIDDRSEKWQESETGEKYRDWKTQFDDIPLGDVDEIEEIEEINVGDEIATYLEENITTSLDSM